MLVSGSILKVTQVLSDICLSCLVLFFSVKKILSGFVKLIPDLNVGVVGW